MTEAGQSRAGGNQAGQVYDEPRNRSPDNHAGAPGSSECTRQCPRGPARTGRPRARGVRRRPHRSEWQTPVPETAGRLARIVDHVASVYPIEIQLAHLAAGQRVTGVTMDDVHAMNAAHARENATVTKEAALDHLRRNSARPQQRSGRSATTSSNAPPRRPLRQCPDHVPVHAGGSRGSAQLSSSRESGKH